MNAKQRKLIEAAGCDPADVYQTSEGWSHNGYVAWQLETAAESKRDTDGEDARIAAMLRALNDMD